MAFIPPILAAIGGGSAVAGGAAVAGLAGTAASIALASRKQNPPPTPPVPNQNAAENAAQQQADMLRQRRGMLANIYGGQTMQQPVSGKSQLGS